MTSNPIPKPRLCPRCGKQCFGRTDTELCIDCRVKEDWLKRRDAELSELDDESREEWYTKYGVIGRWAALDIDSFKKERQPLAYNRIKSCIEHFSSIVLYSPGVYGVGKTHLVSVLANEIVANNPAARFNDNHRCCVANPCPVKFLTETTLLSSIKATYQQDSPVDENMIYKRLSAFELLIIDDVGKVRPHDLSFLQGVYFRLIDERYTNEQHIILTTNLDLKGLGEFIGGASADRLREMCGKNFIKMAGESYRKLDKSKDAKS